MNLINTGNHTVEIDFDPTYSRALLCHSDTAVREALPNNCPPVHLNNLARLSHLLGAIEHLIHSGPLTINSAYRCPALNQKVGGVAHSQHCSGQAADIVCPNFGSPRQLAHAIAASNLSFDQLILEWDRWVHVSVPEPGATARRDILTLLSHSLGYQKGLPHT